MNVHKVFDKNQERRTNQINKEFNQIKRENTQGNRINKYVKETDQNEKRNEFTKKGIQEQGGNLDREDDLGIMNAQGDKEQQDKNADLGKSDYQINRFNERLPHSLIQTLVYNLASEDGKSLAELYKIARDTPHEAQFKDIGSIKEDMIKLLGVIEYFSVEIGVPERQASVITDSYIEKIKHATSQEALEKLFTYAYGDYRSLCLESKYKRPKDKIKSCIEYIETHTESEYDMKLLSELVGYNPSYLSQKFKKVTGMTITEYSLRCRLKEADVLLRHTDVPISEIAALLCFSNQSHFQKVFKKQYKMTPRKWRMNK